MRHIVRSALAAILFVALFGGSAARAGIMVPGVPGSFVYTPPAPFAGKPVTVFYYKPASADARARVLFTFHGAERSGAIARDNWIKAAEHYGVIVFAPEFDAPRYAESLYNFGGMHDPNPERWTFQIIESLFDAVRAQEGVEAASYFMFGHSAGGQYVHRYMLMMPHPRVARAVAANAGTYTMPVYPSTLFGPRFPMILDSSRLPPDALKERFGRPLIVMVGDNDVDTTAAVFPRGEAAMEQGANRLERARHFCQAATAQAKAMEVELKWRCIEVPGVGHGGRSMGKAAAPVLFE